MTKTPDGPDVTRPVETPPHFGANCVVCGKRMGTRTEPIYPGDVPWTYRCADHRVRKDDTSA